MKVIRLYPSGIPSWLRWTLIVLCILVLIPLLLLLALQTKPAQNLVREKAAGFLADKLHTTVSIGSFSMRWFSELELGQVYIADQQNNPLLYSGRLSVRYNLLDLLENKLTVRQLTWSDVALNAYTLPDGNMNYQFMADAFSSPDTATVEADSSEAMQFNISWIDLEKIRIRYLDDKAGMYAHLKLGSLHLALDALEPASGQYEIRELRTKKLEAVYRQAYRPADVSAGTAAGQPTPFRLLAKLFQAENAVVFYSDEGSGLQTGWALDDLSLKLASFDLEKTHVQAGFVQLDQPRGFLQMKQGADTVTQKNSSSPNTWVVESPQLSLVNGRFRMDDQSTAATPYKNAFDPAHFFLSPLNLEIKDLRYTPRGVTALLASLQVADQSGFRIRQATADIVYTDSLVSLKKLLLETNNSHLANEISATAPGWSRLSGNIESLGINARLKQSRLVLSDALYFVPQLKNDPSFKKIWNKTVDIDGTVAGNLTRLALEQVLVTDNAGNRVALNGLVDHPTDSKRLYASFSKVDLQSGKNAILAWLPDGALPSNITLPESLHLNGRFAGSTRTVNTDLQLQSSFGMVSLEGSMENFTDSLHSSYNLRLRKIDMDAGQWIKDTAIGRIVASGRVKGRGFALSKMTAEADLSVAQANYNGYRYHDIRVNGAIDKGNYQAAVASLDSNLRATVQLKGNIRDEYPTVDGKMKLDRVDLMALGLTTSPLVVKGDFDVDVKDARPRALNGHFDITRLQLADAKNIYALDSILLIADTDSGYQRIQLTSPFGYATARGDFDYTRIFTAATAIVQHHLIPDGQDSMLARIDSTHQQMALNASFNWPKSLRDLAPGLELNQPLLIDARVNTDSLLVAGNIALQSLRYDSLRVDSTTLHLLASRDSLLLTAGVASVAHPSFPLYRTTVNATGKDGALNWALSLNDRQEKEKYRLAGLVNMLPDSGYDIRFADQLLLNYQPFSAGDSNLIEWRKNGLAAAALHLTAGDQSLAIKTGPATGALPPVFIDIDRFKLSTITGLLGQDSALAEALIDGKISASNLDKSPAIDANLSLKDIVAKGIPVGDLAAKAKTDEAGRYDIEAALSGFENDVQVKGSYAQQMQFDVAINRLNLHSVEPFTMGQASRMKGYANGHLSVNGTATRPLVNGALGFTEGQANITMINTTLSFPAEKMTFDEKGIAFNRFTLKDSLGGTTSINGRINTTDYTDYAFDLKIDMDNFNVLGPKANEDQLYYGPAFVDSKITVTGNLDRPVVDMQVSLRDKSNVTITIPETTPGLEDRDGVVVFVNRANPADSSLLSGKEIVVDQTGIKGIDLSAVINITKSSTLNIIIDPINGDYLEAKGDASLNFTIDPSSKMSLTGRYEIDEGKYEMSLNQLIKRTFTLEKGSSITWDGDITGAQVDITAKYLVRAPAIDLLSGQVQDADNRQYRQRIPVEVYLMIKDELLKPSISFRLDMPEKDRNIFQNKAYLRIKQINVSESQVNKQVMGLLVLQSFIADDPLSTLDQRAGGSVTDAAKQSVSKILSQQLNNLAGKLIKGVDLNFDLQSEEDYSSGSKSERTTLNVGASKSLFDDRLTVAVGSNIDLTGNTQGNASSLIGDVTIDYAITRDGRYKLRAYQRNQTDAVLQGQIIETGLTFMLVMDYDEFREILRRSKEEKELIKKEKAKRKKD